MNRWLHSARVGVFPRTTTMRQNVGHRQNSRPDSIFFPSSPNSVLSSFSLSPDPEQRVSIKGWAELRQITLSSQPQIETFDGPPTTISQRRFGEGDDNEEMSFGLWCDLCETNEWTCRRDESSSRLERVGLPDKTDSYGIIKALSVCLDILSQIHALMEPTTKSTKQQPTIIITTV